MYQKDAMQKFQLKFTPLEFETDISHTVKEIF